MKKRGGCLYSPTSSIFCSRHLLFLILIFTVAVSVPAALFAQVQSTTSISGTVSDPQGAAVVGADITLTDVSTSTSVTTTSNDAGRYFFPNVHPGVYTMTVNKTGFSVAKIANQTATIGTPLTLNVSLAIGSTSQTVEVTATGSILQTTNATVGQSVEHQELLTMPNLSRDATSLVTLQPGITLGGNSAGAASDQNTFVLDGGTITDDMSGDNNTYIPSFASSVDGKGGFSGQAPSGVIPTPTETIEEFKTSTTGQTADYNGAAGSETVMATKKGTNTLHGSAYEFYNDPRVGGANTWDNNRTGTPIAGGHFNRFGVTAGGPITTKSFLGGKWFVFGAYERFSDPTSSTFERNYPTPLLRAGMMFVNNKVINLNPTATAVPSGMSASTYAKLGVTAGQVIPSTVCPSGPCDPRGLGLNPLMCAGGNTSGTGACSSGLWSTVPLPNDYAQGDAGNTAGFRGTLALPQTSNFGVIRLDHDFGAKWHFYSTYHYYHLNRVTSNQVDVSGILSGKPGTFGYVSTSNRPQVPWFYTAALGTNITNNLTNQFNYSGTRNWWAYLTDGGVPNLAGFPAAFEPGGEVSNDFAPFNTNNQSTRTRYWNGKDQMYGDNLTWLKGNHLFTFGGSYERNDLTHQRIDNGGSINIYEQYIMGAGTGVSFSAMGINATGDIPSGVTSNRYADYYCMILGMVCQSQRLFTRAVGTTATGLPLNPTSSCANAAISTSAACVASPPAIEESIVPTYNLYVTDSWHIKPTVTLSYGLGYTVQLPPFNAAGAQGILVDANNNPLDMEQYMAARDSAALQGQAYDPLIGFNVIGNVNGHPKYPYNPFYKGLSPRVAVAWNPNFDSGMMEKLFGHNSTVVRAGWSRIYGRLNGVDNILVPILAPGLMQVVVCNGPTITNTCGSTPANNFRVGVDGKVAPLPPPTVSGTAANNFALPQPWFPGFNDVGTGAGGSLDPNFRPDRSDEFNVSIQRQLNRKVQVEVGYIGRIIKNEFQEFDLNAIPFDMTLGGQSFANAWGKIMTETNFGANNNFQVQPFFEAALKPSYCAGFSSCTAAFVANEGSAGIGNMGCACAWDAWTDVSTAGNWVFGRSMINDPVTPKAGLPASIGANGQTTDIIPNGSNGWGNYNAAYVSVSFSAWHGLTMRSNFTYGRALGTGSVVQASSSFTEPDPYHLQNDYQIQSFSQKYNYNLYFRYEPSIFKGRNTLTSKLLGGWAITPIFVAYSGFPLQVATSNGIAEGFGQSDTAFVGSNENGIIIGNLNYDNSRKQGITGSGGVGTSGVGQNIFSNPQQAFQQFRNPILGVDTNISSFPLYGLPVWNLDLTLSKDFKITERVGFSVSIGAQNLFNHMQPNDPTFDLGNPTTFGVLGGGGAVQASLPRNLQFGGRLVF
jgi:hypothetical protein